MKVLTPGLEFDATSHRYILSGKPVLGNTRILKLAGYVDDRWFTDYARDRGSAVHRACWYYDEGDLDESTLTGEIPGFLAGWKKFRAEQGAEIEVIEAAVASKLYRFATTPDRVMRLAYNNELAVVEIKTGVPGDGAALQTAGQQLALSENGIEVRNRWAVQLFPNGKYDMKRYTSRADRDDFTAGIRVAYRRLCQIQEPV